jgi:uncharacterized protein
MDVQKVAGSTLAAVLLHPHPDFGGDRFNHVVDALFRSLPGDGISVVRFDFSSSERTVAVKETVAAIDAAPDGAVTLVGYSYGADVALGVNDPRVKGWFLVAPPLAVTDSSAVAADQRPKFLLLPEHDQYSSPDRARRKSATWTNATLEVVPSADHFLVGSSGAVVVAVTAWLRELAG